MTLCPNMLFHRQDNSLPPPLPNFSSPTIHQVPFSGPRDRIKIKFFKANSLFFVFWKYLQFGKIPIPLQKSGYDNLAIAPSVPPNLQPLKKKIIINPPPLPYFLFTTINQEFGQGGRFFKLHPYVGLCPHIQNCKEFMST